MPNVLFVDDDPALSRLFMRELAEQGFEVWRAQDGLHALTVLQAVTPHVIVLDARMPLMDGPTFYGYVRAHERPEVRKVPVVILSAYGAKALRRSLRAEAALDKPVDPGELVAVVQQLAGQRLARFAPRAADATCYGE